MTGLLASVKAERSTYEIPPISNGLRQKQLGKTSLSPQPKSVAQWTLWKANSQRTYVMWNLLSIMTAKDGSDLCQI